jgi:fused signal recognition particle receptor
VITLVIALVVVSVLLLAFVGFFVQRSRGAQEPRVAPPGAPPGDGAVLAPEAEATPATEAPREVLAGPPDYAKRLTRSRGLFASLRSLRGSGRVDQRALDDLEEALLGADVGVTTTDHLLEQVRQAVAANPEESGDDLLALLRRALLELLVDDADGVAIDRSLSVQVEEGRVPVWLFVGVNGVGKTTTIGKLAARETSEGKKVILAAGDTFRAAAADQLATWGERAGADVVRGAEGGDPSAVVFDAIQRGGAREYDLVLADTAGRLQNKVNLIEELKKIRRVADREPGQVSEVLLVLDATTGQNAVSQAREFLDAVEVTGVVLSKLDGTARGGVIITIQRELGLPVKLVGLGEAAEDLVVFDPEAFVDALLAP